MKHSFSSALQYGWPNCEWALTDSSSFDTLIWFHNDIPKPTIEQVNEIINNLDQSEAMRLLRIKRNSMLKDTDVYALPDFPHINENKKLEWLYYRQQLRDLPSNSLPTLIMETYELDNTSVQWPLVPS